MERGERRDWRCVYTDAMNNPNAPPSAKPITPDIMVLPGQDSVKAWICARVSDLEPGARSFWGPYTFHHRRFLVVRTRVWTAVYRRRHSGKRHGCWCCAGTGFPTWWLIRPRIAENDAAKKFLG